MPIANHIYQYGTILYELAINESMEPSVPCVEEIKHNLGHTIDCPLHIQELIVNCLSIAQPPSIAHIINVLTPTMDHKAY